MTTLRARAMGSLLMAPLMSMTLMLGWARAAHAEVLASLGTGLTFEYAADGRTVESRQPLAVRAGYRFPLLDTYFEYQTFHAAQGTPMISVARNHHEFLLWGRKLFLPEWRLGPYLAGGAGFSYDAVETSFGPETSKEAGTPQTLAAAAAGARLVVWKQLELDLEGRVAFSQTYNPNPMIGIGLLAEIAF